MTALYIAAGILLLLAALLLVRVQVGVSYIGDLRVELRLGPLRLDLTPEPAEPAAPEAEAPSGAAHKKKKKMKKEKGKGKAFSAREALPIALDTVGKLLRRTRRWLYCGRFVLKVNVACEDPAQTAALYGLISGQAAALTRAILALRHSRRRGDVFCEVTPDFLSESFDFMIDAAFGLRVWQGAALGITALRGFLKIRKSGKKEDDANEQRASTQADH